jgi:ADP-ribose pyrophosphatase
VLIRNHRPTVDRELLECCAGTIERGDPPADTAARELIEETGYRAGKLTPLGMFYTSPGLSDEMMWVFVATELTHVGQHLEEDENIVVEVVPTAEALAMATDGRMIDAKSMLGLLWARAKGMI